MFKLLRFALEKVVFIRGGYIEDLVNHTSARGGVDTIDKCVGPVMGKLHPKWFVGILDGNEPLPVEVKSTLVLVWQFLTVPKNQ